MSNITTWVDYIPAANNKAVYPNVGKNYVYAVLGSVGELSDLCIAVKRGKTMEVAHEMSDLCWYISAVAFEVGLAPETLDAAENNAVAALAQKRTGSPSDWILEMLNHMWFLTDAAKKTLRDGEDRPDEHRLPSINDALCGIVEVLVEVAAHFGTTVGTVRSNSLAVD